MEKSAVKGSFITNETMQNMITSDLKIERVSRNQKVSNTSEKIMTVYDQIKNGTTQPKAVDLSSDGGISQSAQLSEKAHALVNQEVTQAYGSVNSGMNIDDNDVNLV
jgi:hypothetical protein